MPKPDGDNSLTRDKLRLREEEIPKEAKPNLKNVYGLKIQFSGPGFQATLEVHGEPWAIHKLAQDFSSSINDM
jgi:hypothetical protein